RGSQRVAAVIAAVVDELLNRIGDLLGGACVEDRSLDVSADRAPASDLLLRLNHVDLVEVPEGGTRGNAGIGQHVEAVGVPTFDKMVRDKAFVDQRHDNFEVAGPVELAEVFVGHEVIGALVERYEDEGVVVGAGAHFAELHGDRNHAVQRLKKL